MKPFSPLYFINANRARCILLMLMIFLGYGAYLGGLYISTPQENWEYAYTITDRCLGICASINDRKGTEFDAFCEELEKHDDIRVIHLGYYRQIDRKTVMGFTDGTHTVTFRNSGDMKAYFDYNGIGCDLSSVDANTVVMSRRMADNRGFKVGDIIKPNDENYVIDECRLAAITDEKGYTQYFIGSEDEINRRIVIIENGATYEQMQSYAAEAAKLHTVHYEKPLRVGVSETYDTFNQIFIIVIVFLAFILAVTVNAAFVGMYQRREFEFAVYRAIGISRKRIIGKIIGELICMDAIVLVLGGGIFFLCIYLINELALESKGLYLVYYSPVALIALIICNLVTLIPLIFTRSRRLLKADVCEY